MANYRHKHPKLPVGAQLEKEYEGRIWVLHPTKGYRSRSTGRKESVAAVTNPLAFWFRSLRTRG